ncbi:MAG TPA: Abi-alpha family protein [Terracidiphilus sp.]|nr:Abi-alpha family protein [Terracidiphilus sp.]
MNDLSEAINKAADLIHRLAGPVCDDIGAMISDIMKPIRAKNLVNTLRRTQRILHEAGLPANAVPTRLLFPIADASSIENDETLQEMWAGLLATASQQTDSVSPSFIETLKQLTPDDARHLELICQESVKHFNSIDRTKYFLNRGAKMDRIFDGMLLAPWSFGAASVKKPMEFNVPPTVYPDTYERLGLVRRTIEVKSSFDRRELSWANDPEQIHQEVDSEVDGWYEFTEYCIRFLDACHGPVPTKEI